MGVLNEKALSKNDELIFPVSTLRANKMSCWVLRAANEHSLHTIHTIYIQAWVENAVGMAGVAVATPTLPAPHQHFVL